MKTDIMTLLTPEIRDYPRPFILKTLEIFRSRHLNSIVEIGCMRGPATHPLDELHMDCCMDGHSSLYWAEVTSDLHIVDIESLCVKVAEEEIRKRYPGHPFVSFIMDGVDYLNERSRSIDLLFLDFIDANYPASAQMHLNAYLAAKPNLHEKSLILIDDTDCKLHEGKLYFDPTGIGGKGFLLIPEALKDGWKIHLRGRQTLLYREDDL